MSSPSTYFAYLDSPLWGDAGVSIFSWCGATHSSRKTRRVSPHKGSECIGWPFVKIYLRTLQDIEELIDGCGDISVGSLGEHECIATAVEQAV
jgi:hypothetical protein